MKRPPPVTCTPLPEPKAVPYSPTGILGQVLYSNHSEFLEDVIGKPVAPAPPPVATADEFKAARAAFDRASAVCKELLDAVAATRKV